MLSSRDIAIADTCAELTANAKACTRDRNAALLLVPFLVDFPDLQTAEDENHGLLVIRAVHDLMAQ